MLNIARRAGARLRTVVGNAVNRVRNGGRRAGSPAASSAYPN